jgi:microcystin-dependent protein
MKEGFSYSSNSSSSSSSPYGDTLALANLTEEDAQRIGVDYVVENFPQATPMNVMYSDANGNLATTSDLGLQNLTVNGDSQFANNNVLVSSGDLGNPTAQTRINSQGIIFGGTNKARETNSAQISAGRHDADALCIVGMSKADGSNRRIHMWSEGGTTHEGEIASNLTNVGNFRAVSGGYGTIFRQDGSDFYILNTNANDAMGNCNNLRPFYIHNATGDVGMNHNVSVGGNVNVGGKVQEGGNALIPRGSIILWSGSASNIPGGWALCDGNTTNGTPNLLDRFVLGAGNNYAAGATGGEATHTLTIAEMPSHTHSLPQGDQNWGSRDGNSVWGGNWTANTGSAGGNQPHNNMPPYYALCYIMKL